MNRSGVSRLSANGCALFMLCVLPLLFHDAFFDINRFKVGAACLLAPVFAACALIGIDRKSLRSWCKACRPSQYCMLLLLLSGIISFAMSGFDPATLTGSEGRYCGLYFLLSCAAAFFVISSCQLKTELLSRLAIGCAAVVSALGILNVMGIDPLGFYVRIQRGQEHFFLSTIGNIDFFGAYLAMLLPLAMSQCIFSTEKTYRAAGFAASMILILGIAVSRTDVAFAALQMVCLALLALSGNSWKHIRRALCLWGFSWFALPIARKLLLCSRFGLDYSGIVLALCDTHLATILGLVLLCMLLFAHYAEHSALPAPGRKRLIVLFMILILVSAFLLLTAMFLCTCVLSETNAGSVPDLLRFDDAWGSRRGFVYRRSIRAYRDFTLPEKLFGRGLDMTKLILTPYFDNPEMLKSGVFNDAHNQPLQFLLTCGLFGMAAFLGFFAASLWSILKRAGDDPLLCGTVAFLCGYAVIMLFSVTQPILIATSFTLCALALSRIRSLSQKEDRHES